MDQFRLKRTVTMKNIVRHIKTGCPPTNHSDLFDPIFDPHTQCVSLLPFSSLSLPLWHYQSLPPPLTLAPRHVPSPAFTLNSAPPALERNASSFYACNSSWLINILVSTKFHCRSSNGDLETADLQALWQKCTPYICANVYWIRSVEFYRFPAKRRFRHL